MWNTLIAVAIAIGIFWISLRVIRMLATPPPPDPDPNDILDVEIPYRCTVCGMRLTVTHAQDGEWIAPKHCREEMVIVG